VCTGALRVGATGATEERSRRDSRTFVGHQKSVCRADPRYRNASFEKGLRTRTRSTPSAGDSPGTWDISCSWVTLAAYFLTSVYVVQHPSDAATPMPRCVTLSCLSSEKRSARSLSSAAPLRRAPHFIRTPRQRRPVLQARSPRATAASEGGGAAGCAPPAGLRGQWPHSWSRSAQPGYAGSGRTAGVARHKKSVENLASSVRADGSVGRARAPCGAPVTPRQPRSRQIVHIAAYVRAAVATSRVLRCARGGTDEVGSSAASSVVLYRYIVLLVS
jgi:hypothetical protein